MTFWVHCNVPADIAGTSGFAINPLRKSAYTLQLGVFSHSASHKEPESVFHIGAQSEEKENEADQSPGKEISCEFSNNVVKEKV